MALMRNGERVTHRKGSITRAFEYDQYPLKKAESKRAEVTGIVTTTRILLRILCSFGPSIPGGVLYSARRPVFVRSVDHVWE